MEYGQKTGRCGCALCLLFPDDYEIGMSHLGENLTIFLINVRILIVNGFAPWTDMRKTRKNNIPLFH